MQYQEFIETLRPLLADAFPLYDREGRSRDAAFIEWRRRVTELVERIEAEGYIIRTGIEIRGFDAPQGGTNAPTEEERMSAYNQDLQDTINEMETIIDGYDRSGEPAKAPAAQTDAPCEGSVGICCNGSGVPMWLWVVIGLFLLSWVLV